MKTVSDTVIDCLVELLAVDREGILDKDIYQDLLADSLDQIEIIMLIEEDLNIVLDEAKMTHIRKVAQLITHVEEVCRAQAPL